jgi:hypothetical protein
MQLSLLLPSSCSRWPGIGDDAGVGVYYGISLYRLRYNFSLRRIYSDIIFFWNELHHTWPVILLKPRAQRDLDKNSFESTSWKFEISLGALWFS